jgi:hypothetical protein
MTLSHLSMRLRGEINARGERNTVVDGYQSVKHECYFVRSAWGVSPTVFDLRKRRTDELAQSIDVGVLVGGW